MRRRLPAIALLLLVPLAVATSWYFVDPMVMTLFAVYACVCVFVVLPFLRSIRSILIATALIAFFLSIVVTDWPIRAAFAMARPILDRVADDLRGGTPPRTPLRAGIVRVRRAEVKGNGLVCLWTHVHPYGNSGFVQCLPDDLDMDVSGINVSTKTPLDDRWLFISED